MGAPTKPLQLDGRATCARLVNRCNRTDFPLTHHRWEKHNVRKPSLDGNYYSIYHISMLVSSGCLLRVPVLHNLKCQKSLKSAQNTPFIFTVCQFCNFFCVLIILFLQTAEDICRYTTDHGFLNVRQNMQNFSQLANQPAKDVDFPIHRIYLIYVHSRFCVFHSEQYLAYS